MTIIVGLYLAGVWTLIVASANLNAYPCACQEGNDYGEKHRTS